ncbi:MAG: CDP-alcohol phosphatidyltransferase family protein [Geodermatophilaceae bacterium]|nr:CDP-alcohol phosphatidyltransferase family protein [Geodermatophilaceae bacterium]
MPGEHGGVGPTWPRPWREVGAERGRESGRRALAALPSLFTMLNMACGFGCILVSINGQYALGAVLIGIAVTMDILDGTAARLVGSVTPFGLQFDSLADLVSFGMAPAILAFAWAMGDLGPLGWVGSFVWLAAAAIRLARFNATIDPRADKRFFIGLPSPGAAGVVIASVFAFPAPDGPLLWTLPVIFVPALLMVTSFRFHSFRALVNPRGRPYPLTAFVLVLAAGLATYPAITGCVVAYGYVLHPLIFRGLRPLARLLPRPAT